MLHRTLATIKRDLAIRVLRILFSTLVVVAIAILALRLTHPLSSLPQGTASLSIKASEKTALGAALFPMIAKNEGLSGVIPQADGRDALAARILLARAA